MSFFDDASLAFLPSGAAGKDGKAYSIKPTDGTGDFTFSRGSNLAATRVGADGLIEKGRENLLLQSNQFDTTWVIDTSTASITSGQADKDGGTDAWSLVAKAVNGHHRIIQTFTGAANSINTFSVFAKANGYNFLRIVENASTGDFATFDLSNGSVANTTGIANTATIEAVGSAGWYRCSIAFDCGATTRFDIYTMETSGTTSFVGDGVSGAYIMNAQVEQGLAATDYIESGATTGKAGLLEDEPRFDYSGGATCPSLLLEPSRTQLVNSSEYLGTLVGVTASYVESPEGLNNATRLTENTATSQHYSPIRVSGIVSGQTYAISFYIRKGTYNNLQVYTQSSIMSCTASITFSTETISVAGAVAGSPFMNSVGNGWYRCGWVGTALASGVMDIYATVVNLNSTVGDGTSYTDYYGFQVEDNGAGGGTTYPTSYIPNHSGGSVTRGVDACVKTGISSLIGQTEGTLFAVMKKTDILAAEGGVRLDNETTNTRISINFAPSTATTTRLNLFASKDGVLGAYNDSYITPLQNTTKVAVGYAENNLAFYANGVQVYTDNSFPTYTSDNLTRLVSASNLEIEQILVFPTRLTDAELAELTTL